MRSYRKSFLSFITVAMLTSVLGTCGLLPKVKADEPEPVPTSNMRTVQFFNPDTVIDDFESEGALSNWHSGSNTESVSIDTQDAWNVFDPFEQSKFLIASSVQNLQNNVWRSVYRTFSTPLNLTDSRYIMVAYNHRGYYSYPEPYYARIKVYSGTDYTEGIVRVYNNNWNKIGIDIGSWAGRSAIDKLEISFQHAYSRANHPEDPNPSWTLPEFYIDYVHTSKELVEPTANTVTVDSFRPDLVIDDFESAGALSNWQAGGNTASVDIASQDAWNAFFPFEQSKFLIASGTTYLQNNVWRTISRTFATPLDLSAYRYVMTGFNHRGYYSYPEPYFVKIKLFSGTDTTEGIIRVYNNNWNKIGIDIDNWAGRSAIDKLEISFQHAYSRVNHPEDPNLSWALPEFYIDYVHASRGLIGEGIGVVSQISVDNNDVVIQGTIGASTDVTGRNVEIFELAPYQSEDDMASLTPVANVAAAANREFALNLSRYENGRDRYYSKFVAVLADPSDPSSSPLLIDNPKGVTNIEFNAAHEFPYPTAQSKKGLEIQMADDAEELGISHGVLTAIINNTMYADNSNLANSILYDMDGETYYFNKTYIESLDREIKPLSDNGVIMNMVMILYDGTDDVSNIFIHPDAERGQGSIYAFNTTNEEGTRYFKAAMEFLADRYTRMDEQFGRVMGYIVGNEVDSQRIWQNMGNKTVDEFTEDYERTVRLAYQAVRKKSDNARIYISLDHFWNTPVINDPLKYYKGRDIIEKLNTLTKRNGDFPWNVAYHPYPEAFINPDAWNDHLYVNGTYDSPKITFKNLEVLNSFLSQENMKIDGQQRRIILSEQGFNSPDYSPVSLAQQAASYAYAYYKTQFLNGVDSFMLHRHVDYKAQDMRPGLWTWDTSVPELSYNPPGEKKPIYDVFQNIDTTRSLEVTEYYRNIIGVNDWSLIIPGFDPNGLDVRATTSLLPLQINDHSPSGGIEGDSFETDIEGWELAENTTSVSRNTLDAFSGTASLKADFTSLPKQWHGVLKKLQAPFDSTATPYLNMAVKLSGTAPNEAYEAKIKVYSGGKVAEGTATIDPTKGWNAMSLDLSSWVHKDAIDKIKVWVSSPARVWSGSLLVDDVKFTSQSVADVDVVNIGVTLKSNTESLQIGSVITVDVTNRDAFALQGSIAVTGIGGITFNQSALDVNGMVYGDSKRFSLNVTGYTPPPIGPVGMRFAYRDTLQDRLLTVNKNSGEDQLPSDEVLLYNFENSSNGWKAGSDTADVGSVEYFLNGPGTPHLGSYALAAYSMPVEANKWRSVQVEPQQPLDLTNAEEFFYNIDSFSGYSNSYETRIRLYSGTAMLQKTQLMTPNVWNRISLNVRDWAYRNAITRIEISFRSPDSSMAWPGTQFQIDYVGYTLRQDALEAPLTQEETAMKPMWRGNTMLNESVLMMSVNNGLPEAELLFEPIDIISVKNARLDTEYVEGEDWEFANGKLKLLAGSRIPSLTEAEMVLPSYVPGESFPKVGGGAVLYREGSYFHDRQIAVTYTHEQDAWEGPVPEWAEDRLSLTLDKLNDGDPLKIVLYGDSIAVGANASDFSNVPPHLPIWGQLVADELEREYSSEITFVNPSIGGKDSQWGKDEAVALVANEMPDLVIIAFGMNDGTGTGIGDGLAPAAFKANIESIIGSVRTVNPAAEFILVGTTLPNSETFFLDKQPYYFAELEQLAANGTGIASANLTGVHQQLLLRKQFRDMTGNNINHPNDFLSRWYAQFVLGLLVEDRLEMERK